MDCSRPGSSVHGDSPGKNTGVGYHFLLQGIFPTQGSNHVSCLAGGLFTTESPTIQIREGSPTIQIVWWESCFHNIICYKSNFFKKKNCHCNKKNTKGENEDNWMWLVNLGRKVMTNLDSIFRSRDITLPTKVCLVKAMVFPVVMYGCESWTVKTAECRRIDAFELWCWRRLLRVPWTARRSNQSILKEISPGCSTEGMMLKLKFQYFGHLMWRVDSLEKTDAGRDWEQEEKGTTEDEMARWHHRLNWREFEWIPGVSDGQRGLVCCSNGVAKLNTTERLNWTVDL